MIVSKISGLITMESYLAIDDVFWISLILWSASVLEMEKYPAIIRGEHRVSELVIRDIQVQRSGHRGTEHVIALIGEAYWIVRVRPVIKKIISLCVICQKLRGRPGIPSKADLPGYRVTPNGPSIADVGIDCFGPFLVKRGRVQL